MSVLGPILGLVGGAGSGLGDYYGGMQASHRQRQFLREQSSTQYQRAVHDMRQAGLNPNAIFGSGGGSPAAAMAGGQDPAPDLTGSVGKGVSSGIAASLAKDQATITQASARRADAEADLAVAESSARMEALAHPVGKAAYVDKQYGWAGAAASIYASGMGNAVGGENSAKKVKGVNETPAPKVRTLTKEEEEEYRKRIPAINDTSSIDRAHEDAAISSARRAHYNALSEQVQRQAELDRHESAVRSRRFQRNKRKQ